jgi:tripartite-type tricarboxylate transporter receptor subunit TctC
MVAAIKSPDFERRLDELMLDPGGDTPQEFGAYVRGMYERVGKVIRNANIKAD